MSDYSKIPSNKKATYKQLNGVSAKLSNLLQTELKIPDNSPITGKRLFGRTKAVIIAKHAEMEAGYLTHGDAQVYFAMSKIPASLAAQVKIDDLQELLTADGHGKVKISKPKALKVTVKKSPKKGKKKASIVIQETIDKLNSEENAARDAILAIAQEQGITASEVFNLLKNDI